MASSRQSSTNPQTGEVTAGGRPVHGGVRPAQLRELGLRPEEVLDFSASISPVGPPERVKEAIQRVDLSVYPDPECLELREALSRHLSHPERRPAGVPVERILVGNGSTELIHLLARAFLSPPRLGTTNSALLLSPTYGEYAGACRLVGATISRIEADRKNGFRWPGRESWNQVATQRPGLVFLCNPNNPTGVFLNRLEVESLAQAVAQVGGLLVVDEAYLSFVEEAWDTLSLLQWDNVVLLRSMTKDYALTGLRLGYALAAAEVLGKMALYQPDWSVNGLAQAAGIAALADEDYLPRTRTAMTEAKRYLTRELTLSGLHVLPSAANFLLVEARDGAALQERLAQKGIFVRDCASFGLPDCIRVGVRPLEDCRRLVEAVREE